MLRCVVRSGPSAWRSSLGLARLATEASAKALGTGAVTGAVAAAAVKKPPTRLRRAVKVTAGVVGVATVAAGVGLGVLCQRDEGIRRTVRFCTYVMPILWEYWWFNQSVRHLPKATQEVLKEVRARVSCCCSRSLARSHCCSGCLPWLCENGRVSNESVAARCTSLAKSAVRVLTAS